MCPLCRSTVLEVGEELGVENGVAVRLVVDGEEGVDGGNDDDCEDDRDPNGGLSARDHA